jgi:hypothetical protein
MSHRFSQVAVEFGEAPRDLKTKCLQSVLGCETPGALELEMLRHKRAERPVHKIRGWPVDFAGLAPEIDLAFVESASPLSKRLHLLKRTISEATRDPMPLIRQLKTVCAHFGREKAFHKTGKAHTPVGPTAESPRTAPHQLALRVELLIHDPMV